MYRLRFETIEQCFDVPDDVQLIFPLNAVYAFALKENKLPFNAERMIAELPAVIWEGCIDNIKKQLEFLKSSGLNTVLCENAGAINICRELGLSMVGGAYLNILNTASFREYSAFGLKDITLSFEMPFSKMRVFFEEKKKQKLSSDVSIIIYGYLPLMKFRNCPAGSSEGCKGCRGDKYLTDRKNEKFRILCRGRQYSELLNCVPLYVADKGLPAADNFVLYFTIESRRECKKIFDMIRNREVPDFRRTAGLYSRELF